MWRTESEIRHSKNSEKQGKYNSSVNISFYTLLVFLVYALIHLFTSQHCTSSIQADDTKW